MFHQPSNGAAHSVGIIPAEVQCSICLDNVVDNNQKGIAKLKCGHYFHLACIVELAYRANGAIVCPNCRAKEAGWIFEAPSCDYGGDGRNNRPTDFVSYDNLGNDNLLLQNTNGFGSPGVGTSLQGGISNLPYLNIPAALPSSSSIASASADRLQLGLNVSIDGGPLYGSSSSTASADPPRLGLNVSIDGGPLYCSSSSTAFVDTPLLGLNVSTDGGPLYSTTSSTASADPPLLGMNMSIDGGPLYGKK